MTSDTVSTPSSVAQKHLDYALGEIRVNLGDLTPTEFDEFLESNLRGIDLGELRGFKPLRELISRRPGSVVYGASSRASIHDGVHTLDMGKDVILEVDESGEESISFDSHTLRLVHFWDRQFTFRRWEGEEETEDIKVAFGWDGQGGYIRAGTEIFLAIIRSPKRRQVSEVLVEVRCQYSKVPHKDRYLVEQVHVGRISISDFREHFGDKYPRAANELILGLRHAQSQTVDALKHQLTVARSVLGRLERVKGAIR